MKIKIMRQNSYGRPHKKKNFWNESIKPPQAGKLPLAYKEMP